MIYICGVEIIMYYLYTTFGIVNFNTNGAYFLWKKSLSMGDNILNHKFDC